MPGIVLVEDVGLQVDRLARAADQVQPREQRVLAVVEHQRVVARRVRRAGRIGAAGERAQRRLARAAPDRVIAFQYGVARGIGDALGLGALHRAEPGAAAGGQRQQRGQAGTQHGSHGAAASVPRSDSRNCTRSPSAKLQRSIA